MGFLASAWGLAGTILRGLSLRAYLIMAGLAVFALWSAMCYRAGYSTADTAWRARALEAKIAKLELEIKVQKEADAAEDRMRAELDTENVRQKKLIDDYLAALRSRPDKCLLGDDAGRLQ
jgi:hypothetical protein